MWLLLMFCLCSYPLATESRSYEYTSLGCWKDTSDRAIPTLEGTDSRLNGNYWERLNAIEKCYEVSRSRGFAVFAVQDGGECFGSSDGITTYQKYGPSTACRYGAGGPWANDVYQITEQTTLHPMTRSETTVTPLPSPETTESTAVSKATTVASTNAPEATVTPSIPAGTTTAATVTPSTEDGTPTPNAARQTAATPTTASEATITPSTVSEATVTPPIASNTTRTTGYTATTTTVLYISLLTNIVKTRDRATEGKRSDEHPSSSITVPLDSTPKENKGTTPVVPITVGVAAVVVLCVIGAGTVFYFKKCRRSSQTTEQDIYIDNLERAAVTIPDNRGHDDPSANPRDSHIYAAINPQDVDNFTESTETPQGTNDRPDRHDNNAGSFKAPRDSNNAIPKDLRGTISENIPDAMPEESPYQALNPDTMENTQYTSLTELIQNK